MTPEQMTELAARLRDDVTWVLHMATVGGQNESHPDHARYIECVARIRADMDLIASMAQRVPLSDEENERLRADAERYRWLRGREDGRYMTVYAFRTDVDEVCLGEELDATIDAAMAAEQSDERREG